MPTGGTCGPGSPLSEGGRDAALRALLEIEAGVPPARALDAALRGVGDPRERALATELAYGVTRQRGALDALLAPFCHRGLAGLDPAVSCVLRLGAYQLRHLDRVPAYAAVQTSVDLLRRHGPPAAAGLVNAVLRRLEAAPRGPEAPPPGDDLEALAVASSHPAWLVRRWAARLGRAETEALLASNNRRPGVCLRPNALRTDAAGLLAELAGSGIRGRPGRWLPEAVILERGGAPGDLPALRQGRCTVQGEASMLVAHVAAPRPGDLCLDVAAAPGGKATHLAEWMGDRGTVVANDIDGRRAQLCVEAAARLGLRAVQPHSADARRLPEAFGGRCDVVVADVPCTGLGTLASRPDLRWRKQEADIATVAALQAEILGAAAACVKPGGILVYSTCTTEPEENELVVADLLGSHPEFQPLDLRGRIPAALADSPSAQAGLLRLWPHVHGTDGFFIAGLRRCERRADHGG